MKNNLSKPVLLASLIAFALADTAPSLRAQDTSASGPHPSDGIPTPPAINGGDSTTGESNPAGKPAAKKKKRKRAKKKKAPAGGGATTSPGNGAAQGPSGDLSSGTTPAK
jgi:hypothetical protein